MVQNMPLLDQDSNGSLDSAALFAQSAVTSYLVDDPPGDWRFVVLHAATAAELALKALLASHSRSLIAARTRDSLLHAAGLGGAARGPMRTITPTEALQTALQLHVELRPFADSLLQLMEIRNGVVHLSSQPPEDLDGLVTALIGGVGVILQLLEAGREGFWGVLTSLVSHRMQEHADIVRADAEQRIESARVRFGTRFAPFSPDQLEALRRVTESAHAGSLDRYGSDQATTLAACPACESPAFVTGSLDVTWEVEDMAWVGHVGFYPFWLRCPTCELELEDEQIIDAGVEPDPPPDVSAEDVGEPPEIFDIEGLTDEDWHPRVGP